MKGIGDALTPAAARSHSKFHRQRRTRKPMPQSAPLSKRLPSTQTRHLERLGRPSQHPLPIRKSRRPNQPNHTEAKTQMGLRISKRNHRRRNANSLRRPPLHRSRRRNRLFSRRANRLRLLDLHRRSGVRVSPVLGNGEVYFGDLRGNVYALECRHRPSALEDPRRRTPAGGHHGISRSLSGSFMQAACTSPYPEETSPSPRPIPPTNAARFGAA